jgi:hypothetical protein
VVFAAFDVAGFPDFAKHFGLDKLIGFSEKHGLPLPRPPEPRSAGASSGQKKGDLSVAGQVA